jgi:hypothetical protein
MTGLRAADNPFRADRIEALTVRPCGWTWEGVIDRLEAFGNRGAVVGCHGHGKTTVLGELERRLPGQTLRVDLAADEPQPLRAALVAGDVTGRVVLLDRSERLGSVDWHRLRWAWRSAAGLVIARHRPGRLPTLVRLDTSPHLLEELALELAPDLPTAIVTALPEVFARHHGNIRECLRELYDRYASG